MSNSNSSRGSNPEYKIYFVGITVGMVLTGVATHSIYTSGFPESIGVVLGVLAILCAVLVFSASVAGENLPLGIGIGVLFGPVFYLLVRVMLVWAIHLL